MSMTGHHRQAKVGERQGDAQPKRKQLNPLGGTKGGHKQAIRKQEIQHTSTSAANFSRRSLYTIFLLPPRLSKFCPVSTLLVSSPSLVALEDGVAIKSKHNKTTKKESTRVCLRRLSPSKGKAPPPRGFRLPALARRSHGSPASSSRLSLTAYHHAL